MKSRRPRPSYDSSLRDAYAHRTRDDIIDAAARLFAKKGYGGVSIQSIGDAAAVGRATVFSSVGGKPALLKAAYAAAVARAVGHGDGVPPVDRPHNQPLNEQTTARGYLAMYAAIVADAMKDLAPINEAAREAASADPELRELLDGVHAERRRAANRVVEETARRAPLRQGLGVDEAADLVWVLIDPSIFYMLVHRRGWSPDRYCEWLERALSAELLSRQR